jgi:hypothetical protein
MTTTTDAVRLAREYAGQYKNSPLQNVDIPDVILIARALLSAEAEVERLTADLVEAQQEHTDMMWQRRRADERAQAAEAALGTALVVVEAARAVANFAGSALTADCQEAADYFNEIRTRLSETLRDHDASTDERCSTCGSVKRRSDPQLCSNPWHDTSTEKDASAPCDQQMSPDEMHDWKNT